ncbi:hypothetical protein M427DRAFT_43595 [Gonapodya prolifera JEL478]|uniref:Uncharacterized protein n=1 Tax=Gonapodya prolifera (strain JEL478) TaxID=1344416 RepID=A0A139AJD6_GONPJ|nr:hypothetical protein M427DRAFT_43595 [Gonapodya prolifera JEL478]|eukprot:KXS16525.1 hypothetical protein M427DRAFT_43595 [Gonapodya prolifera JEL478]
MRDIGPVSEGMRGLALELTDFHIRPILKHFERAIEDDVFERYGELALVKVFYGGCVTFMREGQPGAMMQTVFASLSRPVVCHGVHRKRQGLWGGLRDPMPEWDSRVEGDVAQLRRRGWRSTNGLNESEGRKQNDEGENEDDSTSQQQHFHKTSGFTECGQLLKVFRRVGTSKLDAGAPKSVVPMYRLMAPMAKRYEQSLVKERWPFQSVLQIGKTLFARRRREQASAGGKVELVRYLVKVLGHGLACFTTWVDGVFEQRSGDFWDNWLEGLRK